MTLPHPVHSTASKLSRDKPLVKVYIAFDSLVCTQCSAVGYPFNMYLAQAQKQMNKVNPTKRETPKNSKALHVGSREATIVYNMICIKYM